MRVLLYAAAVALALERPHGRVLLNRRAACPVQLAPDLDHIRAQRAHGPVLAGEAAPNRSAYVFVIAPPLSGSTALFGLLASSPNVATLCRAGTVNCEGEYLLERAGLVPPREKYDPDVPKDWRAAVQVFGKYWDASKPLLLEKSPNNVLKAKRIARDLARSGKEVDFVVMSRSPCFTEELEWKAPILHADFSWDAWAGHLVEAAALPGVRTLQLRYEDLVLDPYGVSARLLAFLPALRRLDPAATPPIHALGAPVYGEHGGLDAAGQKLPPNADRAKSVVEYILEKQVFPRKHASVPRKYHELMAELGYTS